MLNVHQEVPKGLSEDNIKIRDILFAEALESNVSSIPCISELSLGFQGFCPLWVSLPLNFLLSRVIVQFFGIFEPKSLFNASI